MFVALLRELILPVGSAEHWDVLVVSWGCPRNCGVSVGGHAGLPHPPPRLGLEHRVLGEGDGEQLPQGLGAGVGAGAGMLPGAWALMDGGGWGGAADTIALVSATRLLHA